MTEYSPEEKELIREASAIEEGIKEICGGKPIGAVYLAIGKALGGFIAQGLKPDFHGDTKMVTEVAFGAFREARRARRG